MQPISVKDLIDSGVHFGCRTSRWNPKMKPYIHGKRNLIHIIDLKKTIEGLLRAENFLNKLAANGGKVLFVGTKRQIRPVIESEATRAMMPFVVERWIGGSLTNFEIIRKRLRRLMELEDLEATGELEERFSKKVVSSLRREKRKISRNLEGIRSMEDLPGAIIVVDPKREDNAVREARKMAIPTICLLDTDCDPDKADIPIPANDDAMKSVQLLITRLTDAVIAGQAAHREAQEAAAKEAAKKAEAEAEAKAAAKKAAEAKVTVPAAESGNKDAPAKGASAEPTVPATPDKTK